jgi:hypothetical protein
MHSANFPDPARRSSRVQVNVPIRVTSLEPGGNYSEVCETLVVNAHGCAFSASRPLEIGNLVHLQRKEGREIVAHVVDCQPLVLGEKTLGEKTWKLAASLDQPGNFWELKTFPEDWKLLPAVSDSRKRPQPSSLKLVSEKVHRQLTNEELRDMVAELVQPLHAEIALLKEKLAQGGTRRSQFDISLSHIPPEVEEKLESRLREDLGTRVLQQTRQQSEQVLESAKDAIGKKMREAQNEFREHLSKELQTVETRSQSLSEELALSVEQHFGDAAEKFQANASAAGNLFTARGEEFSRTLQKRLTEEHEVYRREVQQIQAGVAAESSRLQSQISGLGGRVGELEDRAFRLESDLDSRLAQMAADSVSNARVQLENAVDVVLKELGTRNAKELNAQLDDARAQLKITQKNIEISVSELVKTRVAASLLSFGETMEALARDSVTRWRLTLANNLNSINQILGQQLEPRQLEPESDEG